MRKTSLIVMAGLAALASASATASAQEFLGAGGPVGTVVGPLSPIPVEGAVLGSPTPIISGDVIQGAPAGLQSGPIHPYSYYVEFPNPARTYVPYGPTDTFTYQGQAYGHAYDRWTWPAMSGASAGLGRYYQILR